jgi:1-acyl-sn-glycerol-3-phosphate acyltransferase
MARLRSILFVGAFYLWFGAYTLAMSPLLLAPRRWLVGPFKLHGAVTTLLLRLICGIRVEYRGLENLPPGPLLVAAKHQCMFDTIGPVQVFADSAYVLRDSLLKLPLYGWYAIKAEMIPVDREGHAGALRRMVAAAKTAVANKRQIVIFPEGTRLPAGETGDYKPGVAALYRALGVPCALMATNSGEHWPPHGLVRTPGLIVYEFLEPIPPGLDRREFMQVLEARLEAGSRALLGAK